MATSQNGWSVLTSPPAGVLPGYVTGRVRAGDVQVVFDYLCDRFHKEVEKINVNWSWGWAYRAIRGQTSGFSNHASGTAIDLNAPAHPLGVSGTFSAAEKARVNQILDDLYGVIRWGENYSGRKDGMHFEIDRDADRVNAVADLIRAGKLPTLKPEWKPKFKKAVHFGRVQEQFLIAAGHSEGKVIRLNGVGIIQDALNEALPGKNIEVDGIVGKDTLEAWKRWEDSLGDYRGSGRPRIPDSHSAEMLGDKVGVNFVGKWDD